MFGHNASVLRCAAVLRERGNTQQILAACGAYVISVFSDWEVNSDFSILRLATGVYLQ
jgi:hypothetical protein